MQQAGMSGCRKTFKRWIVFFTAAIRSVFCLAPRETNFTGQENNPMVS